MLKTRLQKLDILTHEKLKENIEKVIIDIPKEKINKSLYEDNHPKTSTKGTGFKDKQKALDTLEIIKKKIWYIKNK